MTLLHISDTHGFHQKLTDLPKADIIVHSGDFTDFGTEDEVLDFLNWFILLPYKHKIFVTGNHDLCLWDATGIEDLPQNVYFLQDCGCEIDGLKFFGLAYNHDESLIPNDIDVLITHEPPMMILDESAGRHWGNLPIRKRVLEIKPKYHLFGHAHESNELLKQNSTVFSNAAILDDYYRLKGKPRLIDFGK